MKRKKIIILVLSAFVLVMTNAYAQTKYTFRQLSQESVGVSGTILPSGSKESGDTSFTIYRGASVSFRTYFVNGSKYDNIFNPNPTGIVINEQYFRYYCDPEKAYGQNYNDFLDAKEITFLGKRYIILINFREDCLASDCSYRCYNIFDLSNPEKIKQVAFSSVFQGLGTFGEFNNDGIIDFVRVAPKSPNDLPISSDIPFYLVTGYTITNGKLKQLANNDGLSHYLYIKGDPYEVTDFSILKHDWFFPLKDSAGVEIEKTTYFAPYISFDPQYKHLYSDDGIRIEKHNWSILVKQLSDINAAKEYCNLVRNKNKSGDVYIMVDQYGGNIRFQVLSGNFVNRNLALQRQKILSKNSISGTLFDLQSGY